MQYSVKLKLSELTLYIPPNLSLYSDFARTTIPPKNNNGKLVKPKEFEILGFTMTINYGPSHFKTVVFSLENEKFVSMRKSGWLPLEIESYSFKSKRGIQLNKKKISIEITALRKNGERSCYGAILIETEGLIHQLKPQVNKKKSLVYPCIKDGQIIGELKIKTMITDQSPIDKEKSQVRVIQSRKEQMPFQAISTKKNIKVSISESTIEERMIKQHTRRTHANEVKSDSSSEVADSDLYEKIETINRKIQTQEARLSPEEIAPFEQHEFELQPQKHVDISFPSPFGSEDMALEQILERSSREQGETFYSMKSNHSLDDFLA